MTTEPIDEPTLRKPLRLWPGVVAALLLLLVKYGVTLVVPGTAIIGAFAGIVGALAILVWWVFFSRAPWSERLGAIALMIVALVVTHRFLDESLATAGMGMSFYFSALPVVGLAFVGWAVIGRQLADGPRRTAMVAAILLACGVWTLVRIDGVTGDFKSDLTWRWATSAEERLLAQTDDEPTGLPSPSAASEQRAEWPGFRGPERNGVVPGVRIESDWSASPPAELWRRPIGPGWSSFAVRGNLLYTQEQRGEHEVVSAYDLITGEPVWRHTDPVRFYESMGGAGPRATPTLSDGRAYTLGATGLLNALDAGDGSVVWSRNAATDADRETPYWGFSGSPLVVDDVVVVAVSGTLIAYDPASGDPRWFGPKRGGSYSSPHLATIDGVQQILFLNESGAIGVAPADGTILWEHAWPASKIVQPALTANGDLLVGTDEDGTRRLALANEPGGWTVTELWTSTRLTPNFNDFVVHDGHAFGLHRGILTCIDLDDGERTWRGGRYGSGQLILLADQDLLLVLSEKGELALVQATAEKFTEVARFPAIDGKTWNHPVLVGDVLLVRNDEEMAAFRLSLERG